MMVISIRYRPKAFLLHVDSRERPMLTSVSNLQARLLDSQKQALLGNRVLLLLAAQKLDAAGTAFQALSRRFPDCPRLKLLRAALLAQTGKVQRH
jgi:predicted Zn-dependent protease